MSFRILVAATWTVLLIAATLLPGFLFPALPDPQPDGIEIPHLDKIVHLVLFAGYGFLWAWAAPGSSWNGRIIAGGLFLTFATEVIQGLEILGRSTDLADAAADLVGLALGLLVYARVGRGIPVVSRPIEGLGPVRPLSATPSERD